MKKTLNLLGIVSLLSQLNTIAIASDFSLNSISFGKLEDLVIPANPKIIVATALLNEKLTDHYKSKINSFFSKVQTKFPNVQTQVLIDAKGSEIVSALQDDNTVGIILLGHSFKTSIGTAAMLGGDFHPLPSNLFSAATSSLRFAAFLGCYGEKLIEHYEVNKHFKNLPGQHTVYFVKNENWLMKKVVGQALPTYTFFGKDGASFAMNQISRDLESFNFTNGARPPVMLAPVELIVTAKDIIPLFEPRYISIDGKIVGVLGDKTHFNRTNDFESFSYKIDWKWLLNKSINKIEISSAELSSGSIADDYILKEVSIRLLNGKRDILFSTQLDSPIHFGDDTEIYQGIKEPLPMRPFILNYLENELPPKEALLHRMNSEYLQDLHSILFSCGSRISECLEKWSKIREQIESEWVRKMHLFEKSSEFLDQVPSHWPALNRRFFQGKLHPVESR